jgi:molecular chaperone GrpE
MSNDSNQNEHDDRTIDHSSDEATAAAGADQFAAEIGAQPNGDPSTRSETDQLREELTQVKERELRTLAEMENMRKRLARDLEQQMRFAHLPLLKDMLDVVDNLKRALDASQPDAAVKQTLHSGVQMVYTQLMGTLDKFHCKPIDATGKPFDPNLHQAIAQLASAEVPAGHVLLEASAGFLLHDRVIRPSQVIVSVGPPATDPTPPPASDAPQDG